MFPAIPLYSLINKVNVSNYIIKEGNFNAKNLQYIDECLKVHYDFYVIRDEQYIKWKFDENPSVKYHLLEVYDGNGLKGLLVFSIAYNGFIFRCPLRMCKLYDMYFKDNGLTLKEVVQIINNYFIGRNEKIEAIYGLFKGNYRPTIRYPKTGRKLLSSYKGAFASPYFSLSDQDLDQITDT